MADMHHITVTVNGTQYQREVESRRLLGDFLRDDLELHSVHFGCEHGVCGACTIHLNGVSVRACLTFAVQADGAEITTVEAIGTVHDLHPLQHCFRENHALQCGFCTPGMIMTILDLKQKYPLASADEIREGISGNLCRCTGYQNIVSAVQEWVKK
jgi:aerobic-type carbon monoxide dehydrogenase small subunit (CoxS/CutS family)